MCEGDCKITLHPSGDCQFSAVDAWVKKVAGRRNAERHIVKWHSPRPTGSAATEVLQIRIPESELRAIDTTEDLSEYIGCQHLALVSALHSDAILLVLMILTLS
jgi:hypothetical protein